jgi:chromosome segregation ATPase
MNGGGSRDQILEFRIEQVKSELDEVEGRAERKRRELDELQSRRKQHREKKKNERRSKLEEARETLDDVPRDPENPAVENWAEKIGITPEELLDELYGDE